MQYDKKVIDINTHPYLLEDVCRTQEQYQLVYDVTGLYHNGVASMPSTFARLDCAKIDLSVLSPLDLTTTKGTWMTTNEDVEFLCKKYPERFLGQPKRDRQIRSFLYFIAAASTSSGWAYLVKSPG